MAEALIGIVSGILIRLFILLLELRLASKGTFIVKTLERAAEARFRPKGAVIQPPDEIRYFERRSGKGQDTQLEQIP